MSLWKGRFAEPPSDELWRFTVDPSDHRLLGDDIAGSIAHVKMLGATGIVNAGDADILTSGLTRILEEAVSGSFVFAPEDEDVHTALERRLIELVGEVGKKVHTGRSRNDQTALALRRYLLRSVSSRIAQLDRLVGVLTDRAEETADLVVASFTHLQQAQPISLGHHLLAYAWMLLRDGDRFSDALPRLAVSPLGAGAGGGSSLPLDPELVSAELGFAATFDNSLDAVASRDFAAEYAFCCAQLMTHLSRLAEDLILWATAEFGWVTLPARYTTGSSALPHKKNPDILELIRGRTARVVGDVVTMLGLQKGLPLSYNRDLQEDKAAVFDADDTAAAAVGILTDLLGEIEFHPQKPSADTTALDLAETLVGRGVAFRDAYSAVAQFVARLEADGRGLADATAADVAGTVIAAADLRRLDPVRSMEARSSPGGGSSASVRSQIAVLRARLTPAAEDHVDNEVLHDE